MLPRQTSAAMPEVIEGDMEITDSSRAHFVEPFTSLLVRVRSRSLTDANSLACTHVAGLALYAWQDMYLSTGRLQCAAFASATEDGLTHTANCHRSVQPGQQQQQQQQQQQHVELLKAHERCTAKATHTDDTQRHHSWHNPWTRPGASVHTLLRNMGESSTVEKAGAKSRIRGGLTDGEDAAGTSGTDISSFPATLLVSDAVRDPKMLPKPRRDPIPSVGVNSRDLKLALVTGTQSYAAVLHG